MKLTKEYYGTFSEHVDFEDASEAARVVINKKVEEQTKGKIKNFLPSHTLPRATRLVLTNAIYFKGDWQSPFKAAGTAAGDFHITNKKTAQAPFMHQRAGFQSYDDGSFQALAMPYKGNDVSKVIFLPAKNVSLAAFEGSLTANNIRLWLDELDHYGSTREVNLLLPKFKATLEFDLVGQLQAMGIKEAFCEQADFSGIRPRKRLKISAIRHKAYVAVDEKGSEAATATAVVVRQPMMYIPSVNFRADHPFVFLIRDNRSGSILFLGRVSDPSK